MDKVDKVLDIKPLLEKVGVLEDEKKSKYPQNVGFQTSPIYKKLLNFANVKLKDKFSIKDLFH